MAPEEPLRGEDGKFAAADAGAQGAETPAEGAGGDELHKVQVDGETKEVTLQEALDGYQRRETFTKRMMEQGEREKELERREAALSGANTRSSGFGGQPMPGPNTAGNPIAPWGAGVGTSGPYGQSGGIIAPNAAQAPPPTALTEDEMLDPETAQARRQAAYFQGELQATRAEVQAIRREQAEQQEVERLGFKYADFDAKEVEAAFFLLPASEQARLQQTMSKSTAFELIYLERRNAGQQQAATTGPQDKEQTVETATNAPAEAGGSQTPRIDRETPTRRRGSTDDAPINLAGFGQNRAQTMAAMAALNKAEPPLTLEQERERQQRG